MGFKPYCDGCGKQISVQMASDSNAAYYAGARQRGLQVGAEPIEHFCKTCLPRAEQWWFQISVELSEQLKTEIEARRRKALKKTFQLKAHEGGKSVRTN